MGELSSSTSRSMGRVTAICLLLLGHSPSGSAQADPLWTVWNDTTQPDSARLNAMQVLAWRTVFEQPDSGITLAGLQLDLARRSGFRHLEYEAHTTLAVGSTLRSDYAMALEHLRSCLRIARGIGDRRREANAHSNMSNVYRNLGDLPRALEELQSSMHIDLLLGNKEGLAGTYSNIGNIHSELGDLDLALDNYQRSADLAEELDSDRIRAQAQMNLGAVWLRKERPDTAIAELHRALALYRTMGRKLEMGMALNNLGRALGQLGRMSEAHTSLDSALVLLNSVGSGRQIARNWMNRGELHRLDGMHERAIAACTRGLRIALEEALPQQEMECRQCLMQAHEAMGDYRKAFIEQRRYMALNDSLETLNNSREVTRLEVTRVFQERMLSDSLVNVRQRFEQELAFQEDLGREKLRRNALLFSGIGILVLSIGLWTRLRHVRRSRAAIQHERDRSEHLLLNILPAQVAEELKSKGVAEAKQIDQVTVLFTDFKGFTAMSEQLTPKQLVKDLHECFSAFDAICQKYGIEKIKTIGDAYMAAGGLPVPNTTHALDVIGAAFEMRDFIAEGKARKVAMGQPYFEIRIGIHTGPVVAGIVGVKKFSYDIWGDTVNTASRMESSGEVGHVNISEATYTLVRERSGRLFDFTPRGKIRAKGKGEMAMYFAERAVIT